jgi:hypothetical protein
MGNLLMTQVNKLSWDFTKKIPKDERIAALRIRFMNILDLEASNEMYIRIPNGGRCEYSPLERMFHLYDSDGDMIRNVQAPEDTAVDISYIDVEYLELLDSTNPEFRRDLLN